MCSSRCYASHQVQQEPHDAQTLCFVYAASEEVRGVFEKYGVRARRFLEVLETMAVLFTHLRLHTLDHSRPFANAPKALFCLTSVISL